MKTDSLKLAYTAASGIVILRDLNRRNVSMEYGKFAVAIGLTEKWHIGCLTPLNAVLKAMDLISQVAGEELKFDLHDVDGKPGTGFYRSNRIVEEEGHHDTEIQR